MSQTKIADRIRNLLKLSESNNSVEEAALAASMAQELMYRYQLRAEDLVLPETPPEPVEDGEVLSTTRYETWKSRLLVHLARSFGANMYYSPEVKYDKLVRDDNRFKWKKTTRTGYRVVGLQSVVQTVQYMATYLINEINDLAEKEFKHHGSGNGKTWKNNFRLGAVHVIAARLQEKQREQVELVRAQKEAATAAGTENLSLALYQTDQLRQEEAYRKLSKEKGLRARASSQHRLDLSAFDRGKEAGGKVSLGGGKGLSGPKTQLP